MAEIVPVTTHEHQELSFEESNLVLAPLFLVDKKQPSTPKRVLEGQHRENGRSTNWRITVVGTEEYGLPNAFDQAVHLALLSTVRHRVPVDGVVKFTLYDLAQRCRQSTEGGWAFDRLRLSLLRMKTTSVVYDRAWWDKELGRHRSTMSFSLIDDFELTEGKAAVDPSTVRYSSKFWTSVRAGYTAPIDLEIYHELGSAVAQSLYRYLARHVGSGKRFPIGRELLAKRLNLSPHYRPATERKLISAAAESLAAHGLLKGFAIEAGAEGEVVRFVFGSREEAAMGLPIVAEMIRAGVSPKSAARFAMAYPSEEIGRHLRGMRLLEGKRRPTDVNRWLNAALRGGWVHPERPVQPSLILLPDPGHATHSPSAMEVEAAREKMPKHVLDRLRTQAQAEVMARPLYKGREIGAGARIMIEQRLAELVVEAAAGSAHPEDEHGRNDQCL